MQLVSEWNEFNLCRELHKTPDELEAMDAEVVQKWLLFIAAEREAKSIVEERATRKNKRGRK